MNLVSLIVKTNFVTQEKPVCDNEERKEEDEAKENISIGFLQEGNFVVVSWNKSSFSDIVLSADDNGLLYVWSL